jgi:hypothetical protein
MFVSHQPRGEDGSRYKTGETAVYRARRSGAAASPSRKEAHQLAVARRISPMQQLNISICSAATILASIVLLWAHRMR